MNVKKSKFDTFTPFDLTIRIETPEEQAGLYNIFNHSFIVGASGIEEQTDKIRRNLEEDQRFPFEEFDGRLIKRYKNKGDI
jgi:nicotinic acid phosphoribosyltransferase